MSQNSSTLAGDDTLLALVRAVFSDNTQRPFNTRECLEIAWLLTLCNPVTAQTDSPPHASDTSQNQGESQASDTSALSLQPILSDSRKHSHEAPQRTVVESPKPPTSAPQVPEGTPEKKWQTHTARSRKPTRSTKDILVSPQPQHISTRQQARDLYSLAHYIVASDSRKLDIPKTVVQTAATGGVPRIVFAKRKFRASRLLIILDQSPTLVPFNRAIEQLLGVAEKLNCFESIQVLRANTGSLSEAFLDTTAYAYRPQDAIRVFSSGSGQRITLVWTDGFAPAVTSGGLGELLSTLPPNSPLICLHPWGEKDWQKTPLARLQLMNIPANENENLPLAEWVGESSRAVSLASLSASSLQAAASVFLRPDLPPETTVFRLPTMVESPQTNRTIRPSLGGAWWVSRVRQVLATLSEQAIRLLGVVSIVPHQIGVEELSQLFMLVDRDKPSQHETRVAMAQSIASGILCVHNPEAQNPSVFLVSKDAREELRKYVDYERLGQILSFITSRPSSKTLPYSEKDLEELTLSIEVERTSRGDGPSTPQSISHSTNVVRIKERSYLDADDSLQNSDENTTPLTVPVEPIVTWSENEQVDFFEKVSRLFAQKSHKDFLEQAADQLRISSGRLLVECPEPDAVRFICDFCRNAARSTALISQLMRMKGFRDATHLEGTTITSFLFVCETLFGEQLAQLGLGNKNSRQRIFALIFHEFVSAMPESWRKGISLHRTWEIAQALASGVVSTLLAPPSARTPAWLLIDRPNFTAKRNNVTIVFYRNRSGNNQALLHDYEFEWLCHQDSFIVVTEKNTTSGSTIEIQHWQKGTVTRYDPNVHPETTHVFVYSPGKNAVDLTATNPILRNGALVAIVDKGSTYRQAAHATLTRPIVLSELYTAASEAIRVRGSTHQPSAPYPTPVQAQEPERTPAFTLHLAPSFHQLSPAVTGRQSPGPIGPITTEGAPLEFNSLMNRSPILPTLWPIWSTSIIASAHEAEKSNVKSYLESIKSRMLDTEEPVGFLIELARWYQLIDNFHDATDCALAASSRFAQMHYYRAAKYALNLAEDIVLQSQRNSLFVAKAPTKVWAHDQLNAIQARKSLYSNTMRELSLAQLMKQRHLLGATGNAIRPEQAADLDIRSLSNLCYELALQSQSSLSDWLWLADVLALQKLYLEASEMYLSIAKNYIRNNSLAWAQKVLDWRQDMVQHDLTRLQWLAVKWIQNKESQPIRTQVREIYEKRKADKNWLFLTPSIQLMLKLVN